MVELSHAVTAGNPRPYVGFCQTYLLMTGKETSMSSTWTHAYNVRNLFVIYFVFIFQEDDYNPIVLQTALRNAHAQRLADLEALERDMGHQIRSMQKRKYEITAEKRQHVACLVHVLSCYKKRRWNQVTRSQVTRWLRHVFFYVKETLEGSVFGEDCLKVEQKLIATSFCWLHQETTV